MRLLILALTLVLSPCALAQTMSSDLEDRLKSISGANLTVADCHSQVARANESNAVELIYGGQVCAAIKMPLEASFLLLAGQMRATSDILLMPPATQADDQSLMPLYGMLYFGGGLNGVDDDILHDPQSRTRFFELLDQWSPSYSPAYHPGWNARKRPDAELYAATIAQAKADLRTQLDRIIRLVSDEQYYTLAREYNAILARIPHSGLAPGMADFQRFQELREQMRLRGIAIGVDMGPPPPSPDAQSVTMDPTGQSADSPPAAPDKDEQIIPFGADPVVEKCRDQAERMAVSSGGKIDRTQLYTSPKWGLVYRADFVGGDTGSQRFTCTKNFIGMQPIDLGELQPLAR